MKTYIAGPMSGIPYYNFPAFIRAGEYLRRFGEVVNPAEMDIERGIVADPQGKPLTVELYEELMADDLRRLKECDEIYMLKGWEGSAGAKRELACAIENGLNISLENTNDYDDEPDYYSDAGGFAGGSVANLNVLSVLHSTRIRPAADDGPRRLIPVGT